MDEGEASPFVFFPGDVVTITTVSSETTVQEGVVVDEAGRIHVPLVGDVTVGGEGLAEAEARLEEGMQRFDRFARVNIYVADPAGHTATVLGSVTTPGQVSVGPGARIADLLASAGGPRIEVSQEGDFIELADLERATVHRGGEQLPISLVRALAGDPRHNVRARPGDHVHVPPHTMPSVSVLGALNASTTIRYHRGMRVSAALAMAGSPNEFGDGDDVRIVRGGPDSPEVYSVSLQELQDGEGNDPILAPGDVVIVHESGGAKFARVMTAVGPILAAVTAVAVAFILIETR